MATMNRFFSYEEIENGFNKVFTTDLNGKYFIHKRIFEPKGGWNIWQDVGFKLPYKHDSGLVTISLS